MRSMIALAFASASITATAEPIEPNKIGNGADALVTCSSREVNDYVFCQGFIRGYVSAMALAKFSDENPEAQKSNNLHRFEIDFGKLASDVCRLASRKPW